MKRWGTDFNTKGFTLIELLVVIAIIGLLASVVLASLNSARVKARDAKREGDLHSIAQALELYANDHGGSYPYMGTACGTGGIDAWSSWGCWSSMLSTAYIPSMPTDPLNIDLGSCGSVQNCHIYHYCTYNNNQNYELAVNLENAPSRTYGSPPNCGTAGPNQYWIGN
jgi:prepilin-type N-terminal cleavage/methylation domain-containing protein